MIEFVLLILILSWMSRSPMWGYEAEPRQEENAEDPWKFKSVDDCFEYKELRATGWRGDVKDFYKWKEENDE